MMKFKHVWLEAVHGLPDTLRACCIDYAAWKKASRAPVSMASACSKLEAECRTVDAVFCRAFGQHRWQALLAFALLNRTCIVKLCKRIDRRSPGAGMRDWFAHALRPSLRFCGGAELRRLELDSMPQVCPECPVCLEERFPIVVLDCGHDICMPCFEKLHGIECMHGTLENRLVYARFHAIGGQCPKCPMCRQPHPLSRVRSWCVVGDDGTTTQKPWLCWCC